jgi:predicted RNA-binding Zn-ribbon protein involved in translation (DUF1610 family)
MAGYAPGWYYLCPSCGQRGPAADLGMIRVGASSRGKKVLLRCPQCGETGWLRIIEEGSSDDAKYGGGSTTNQT